MNTFNPDLPPGLTPGFLTVESSSGERNGRAEAPSHAWDDHWDRLAGQSRHPLKVGGELIFVLIVFLLTLPLVGLAFLIVKLTSRGAGIYSQNRVGMKGRSF